jgi:indolepyruvate ferredoxin oxidoreductase beta subunit
VQSTSIPGVAQRTGATTYYIEIVPVPWSELGGNRPVLALAPGIGDVDIVLASELMEAGRAIGAGFVTPDRTLMIASTARSYLVVEKVAMADGRFDSARLVKAIEDHAQEHLLIDMEALAKQSGAMVNAVMLGIIAGCERLPISAASFEGAIRADGKAVDANLRGFRAGLKAVQEASFKRAEAAAATRRHGAAAALADLERTIQDTIAASARDIVIEGVRRLTRYQDIRYARRYLDRLAAIQVADGRAQAGGRLLREPARHLAVRMSYEDVIRVSQAKIDPARMERIVAEIGVKPGEPFTVTEFLKPGSRRCARSCRDGLRGASLPLPSGAAGSTVSIGRWSQHRVSVRLPALLAAGQVARLASAVVPLRAGAARDRRLARADRGGDTTFGDLALEIAECARLIKGYGDTWKRGTANYQLIESRIIQPVLAGDIPLRRASTPSRVHGRRR